ncbi:MAG: hypothetical protein AAB288_08120, partial [Acidobacteriota bacterium]
MCSVPLIGYASRFTDQQTLDKLLWEARSAVGTESELSKIRSITATAECIGPKGKYTTSLVSFATDKTRFEQTFSYSPKDRPSLSTAMS